jgi:hypothetical protein
MVFVGSSGWERDVDIKGKIIVQLNLAPNVEHGSAAVLTSVLSAHLDGYGVGEPWGSDRIYNGAFDDAAYVAALLELSERFHESGIRLRRSILFAIFTGEEKGLLGGIRRRQRRSTRSSSRWSPS